MSVKKRKGSPYWYSVFQYKGKRYNFSWEITLKHVAQKNEDDFRKELEAGAGRTSALKSLKVVKAPKEHTIGEIIGAYATKKNAASAGIKWNTVKRNAEALRRFVAISRGIPIPDLQKIGAQKFKNRRLRWAAKREALAQYVTQVDATPVTFLTAPAVKSYKENSNELGYSITGINSTLQQAVSVFSKDFLEALELPDLQKFKKYHRVRTQASSGTFVKIPKNTLEQIEEEFKKLRDSGTQNGKDLWRAYVLFRGLGMRNVEVKAAKGKWVAEFEGDPSMCIINRETEFQTKAGIERHLTLSEQLVHEFSSVPPEEFLVGTGKTKTYRAKIVDREINKILRTFLPDRQKCAYELRKQAGAEIASDPARGIYAAKSFLGHSSVITTEKHYGAYLNKNKALEH